MTHKVWLRATQVKLQSTIFSQQIINLDRLDFYQSIYKVNTWHFNFNLFWIVLLYITHFRFTSGPFPVCNLIFQPDGENEEQFCASDREFLVSMMMMSGKFCDLDHKALITGKCLKVTSGILPVYKCTGITRSWMIF